MASPSAAAIILHDLGEDSGAYVKPANRMSLVGISAYAMDLRGHGNSCGDRGHAESLDRMVRDVELFVNLVYSKENMKPFLVGQGFGALLAVIYAARGDVAGLVLSSPLVTLKGVDNYVRGLKASLMNIVVAKKRVLVPLGSKVRITIRLLREISKAVTRLEKYAKKVRQPVCVMYDPNSNVIDPGAVKSFFDELGSRDKSLVELSGGYRLLGNSEEAIRVATDWILERTK